MNHKKMYNLFLLIGTICIVFLVLYLMGRAGHVTEMIVMMNALGLFCLSIIVFKLVQLVEVQKKNLEINEEISKKLDKLN